MAGFRVVPGRWAGVPRCAITRTAKAAAAARVSTPDARGRLLAYVRSRDADRDAESEDARFGDAANV